MIGGFDIKLSSSGAKVSELWLDNSFYQSRRTRINIKIEGQFNKFSGCTGSKQSPPKV